MLERLLGDLDAAEHARQFADPLVLGQLFDARERAPFLDRFLNDEVSVRHSGNLRQMRDAEHLMVRRDLLQFFPDDLRHSPANTGAASYYYNRAVVRLALNRTAEARADLNTVLQLDPNHAEALLEYARLEARENNAASAIELLRRLKDLSPKVLGQARNNGDFARIQQEAAFIALWN